MFMNFSFKKLVNFIISVSDHQCSTPSTTIVAKMWPPPPPTLSTMGHCHHSSLLVTLHLTAPFITSTVWHLPWLHSPPCHGSLSSIDITPSSVHHHSCHCLKLAPFPHHYHHHHQEPSNTIPFIFTAIQHPPVQWLGTQGVYPGKREESDRNQLKVKTFMVEGGMRRIYPFPSQTHFLELFIYTYKKLFICDFSLKTLVIQFKMIDLLT